MNTSLKLKSGQSGFSLIEILVAAVVLGILTVSVFYFLSTQNGLSVKGNDVLKGANLGKLKFDSLKVASYDALASGSDTVSERYIRSWHVTQLRDGNGNLNGRKQVELTIFWPLTADHSVSFASMKSDDKYKVEVQ
jgi:prepilin-type N-terminal cleavage/methylation domain-containing protein